MSSHCEEQEMEAEALAAIFDTAFEILRDEQPFEWSVRLVPVDCGGDQEEEEAQNHVAIKLICKIPLTYPEEELPAFEIEIVKGLAKEHETELVEMANTEAQANEGMPAIFAVCEALREWLNDNNVKGLDDASMHAQMMRKQKDAEKTKAMAQMQFESQKKDEAISQAELEEISVRKRREEGTPCTTETFMEWKKRFDAEMAELKKEQQEQQDATGKSKKKEKIVDKSDRLTGFEQFSKAGNLLNLEAIEAAADQLEEESTDDEDDEIPEKLDHVDEDLFDDEEDLDLDDLDFDDSSEEEDELDI